MKNKFVELKKKKKREREKEGKEKKRKEKWKRKMVNNWYWMKKDALKVEKEALNKSGMLVDEKSLGKA